MVSSTLTSALDTYLGWEQPQHHEGCKRPQWDVSIRRDDRASRYRYRGEPYVKHSCPGEDCGHGDTFDQVMVRIVCTSCGAARVLTGEDTPDTGETLTSTRHLGYGLPPRRLAGLLLWPGQPWLDLGRALDEEPHDFVVTGPDARQVTTDTVVGQITQGRGKQGGVIWSALAAPSPDGQYGFGQPIRYVHANDGRGRGGKPLRNVTAAAKWIGARLAEHQANGGAA